jgi:BolA protein
MSERIEMIRDKLTAAFSPEQLDIVDESHLHAGHPGARSGGGHFVATIVSKDFSDKNMLARHRMIYDALGDMMNTEIHALSIKAYTPEELNA